MINSSNVRIKYSSIKSKTTLSEIHSIGKFFSKSIPSLVIILASLFVITPNNLSFAGTIVKGIVISSNDGKPIADVNISLLGSSQGTVSNNSGFFNLENRILNGEYKLSFEHIAYENKIIDVLSTNKDNTKIIVKLTEKSILIDPIEVLIDDSSYDIEKKNTLSSKISIRKLDIEKSETVLDLLENNSSVLVSSTNGVNSRISIRGSDSDQVTVMLDGISINSKIDGSFDLSTIPTEIIERVDVYKQGNISISSQAVGGLINIITKKNMGFNNNDYNINKPIFQINNFSLKSSTTTYISDRDRLSFDYLENQNHSLFSQFQVSNFNFQFSTSKKSFANKWTYINAAKADRYRYINNPNTARIQENSWQNSTNYFLTVNRDFSFVDGSKILSFSYIMNYSINENGIPGWYDQSYSSAKAESNDFRNRFSINFIDNNKLSSTSSSSLTNNSRKRNNYKLDFFYDVTNKNTLINEISPIFYTNNDEKFINKGAKFRFHSNSLPLINYLAKPENMNFSFGLEYLNESVSSNKIENHQKSRDIGSFHSSMDKNFLFEDYGFKKDNNFKAIKFMFGLRYELFSLNNSNEDNNESSSSSSSNNKNVDLMKSHSGGILFDFSFFKGKLNLYPKFKYETNFRLPSFSSLFWIDNMFSTGNEELKPEYSETKEFSINFTYSPYLTERFSVNRETFKISGGIEFYKKDLTNLIVWVKRNSGQYTPENRNRGEISGSEMNLELSFFDGLISINSSYNTLHGLNYTNQNSTDGKFIIYKPEDGFNLDLKFNYENQFNLNLKSYYNGKMYLNETNSIDIDPFWLFDTDISYKFLFLKENYGTSFTIYSNIKNILDEQYQIVYGYPMPGRSVEIGMKFGWL